MKVGELITAKNIKIGLTATNKKELLSEMLDILVDVGSVAADNKGKLTKVLLERESLGSTGIGQGIGIPHGKSNSVDKLVAAFGISKDGVNFDSLDGEPTYIFFLLIAPADSTGPHLKALARISRFLRDRLMRQALKNVKEIKQVLALVKEEDNKTV